jgi:DNA modification methylase
VTATILQGNALDLPLDDNTVDLVVTSPPYFGLRSYQDAGEHYDGQLGSEATPAEFVDALIAATREMVRVVKPSGSIWVNLGDKYSQRTQTRRSSHQPGIFPGKFEEFSETWAERAAKGAVRMPRHNVTDRDTGAYVPEKSLMGIPWRYALACIDDLGLILRAEVIWSKPNGLPESVTDRVRRSHETWFHFTLNPRYYSAVDEIREEHTDTSAHALSRRARTDARLELADAGMTSTQNVLGKLPGSVWTIPTQPLTVPPELGVDHFAAFPMEWPRRIVTGWSPREVCTVCGQGRRPVASKTDSHREGGYRPDNNPLMRRPDEHRLTIAASTLGMVSEFAITGYACACPHPTAPATPGVVLDPFGGTGTTALVAHALGRHGISIDMSADYCRLARWRTSDPKELARAQQREYVPPREQVTGQDAFDFEGLGA